MSASTIREKLYDYIRFADEKKVKAIYTILEAEITEELNLWDDPAFVDELDKRLAEFESGNVNGSTWAEIKAEAQSLKVP
jgi:hypothetical protein